MRLSVKNFFERLDKDHLQLVDEFYDEDCRFQDPIANFSNRKQILAYYTKLYKNVEWIKFDFHREVRERQYYSGTWTMMLQAKAFNRGKPISVDGISYIEFGGREGKAIFHRDYFDMGEFVYEWVPIIGPQVRFIKSIFIRNHKPV